jgi:hypothetical protein
VGRTRNPILPYPKTFPADRFATKYLQDIIDDLLKNGEGKRSPWAHFKNAFDTRWVADQERLGISSEANVKRGF